MFLLSFHSKSAGNGYRYEYLGTHRVWRRALKLLSKKVLTRVRIFFINEGMGMNTVIPYPLGTHCHPRIQSSYYLFKESKTLLVAFWRPILNFITIFNFDS